ncbi:hypothetical protein BU15DRAFT_64469 [Melanogaster broomeanus]|nr:hypothetical protein BU15DRAFT_64469 [Melanogaster broomeanus]
MGGAKKTTKSNKENSEASHDAKPKARTTTLAKPENHHMTDSLLTLIEDSVTWKGALGFDKGAEVDSTPTGKGKNFLQHCADIATAFFVTGEVGSEWEPHDVPSLKIVIKNQINRRVNLGMSLSLKTTYQAYRKELGETGHGLVVAGREEELYEGSPAANVYEDIQKKFPWYRRMDELMGSSPAHNRSAVSNSQSTLDLSVLGGNDTDNEDNISRRTPTPMDDDDVIPWPLSPLANLHVEEDVKDVVSPRKLKLVVPSKRSADSAAVSQSTKKRKTPQDLVKEVADAERQARLVMNETNAKHHIEREQIKRNSAYETAVTVERMRLKVQEELAAAQRAHDLVMIEKQIELARIQAAFRADGAIDPQLQG